MEITIKLTKKEKQNLRKAKIKLEDFAKTVKKAVPKVRIK